MRQPCQRTPSGPKKIPSAASLDETRHAEHARANRQGLYREAPVVAGVMTGDRVGISIQAVELRIVHPGLLDEFELTPDVGDETDKMQSAGIVILRRVHELLGRHRRRERLAVAASPAKQSVPPRLAQRRRISGSRTNSATRIDATNVRSDAAGQSLLISAVIEV